ncbi:hypothetical protein GQ44DRAFT_814220 [Phaeosphaeriaceae sp. PMI808]|nr:hypothetical protein GQ44DRAFT_814220 [Phaeosphaeriaceae sp. PMI808]
MSRVSEDSRELPPSTCVPSSGPLNSDLQHHSSSNPASINNNQQPDISSMSYTSSSNISATVSPCLSRAGSGRSQPASGVGTPVATATPARTGFLTGIQNIFAQRPIGHSLIHGAGLKPFSFKKKYKGTDGQELPKPVMVKSRLLALASLDIHLLPVCITVFIIAFNSSIFVNGPPISTLAQYALQGASKLHEMTIVASLARVVVDLLRYYLINDGVNFGMLSSPFSFVGLNYLWSQELLSTVQCAFRLRSKRHAFFLGLLVMFCFLAAIVGPASALLFLPNAVWLSTGSTELFLLGPEDQLWPQNLTMNHTGPKKCEMGGSGDFYCLQGGWNILNGFVTPEGVSSRTVNMVDAWTARMMWLWRPSWSEYGTDSWASAPHGASVYLADRARQDHDHAWGFAKGRQRRLRDATVSGLYSRVTGRIPVVRVLCGPIKPVNNISPTLLFPVLDADRPWRTTDTPGLYKEVRVNGTYSALVNTTWISLQPEFGTSTAALAFVTNNATAGRSAGCGCSFDARWAEGQSALHGESKYWQAFIGPPSLPAALKFMDPQGVSFFDPLLKKYYGRSIASDTDWVRQLSTGYALQDSTGNFTALELILVSTRLWDMSWVLDDKVGPIRELEAVLSAYFVNAISRLGWDPQRHPTQEDVNPLLRMGNRDNDNLLHEGGQIWQRPNNVSTQALKQEWFVYATAWQLKNDPALYISVVVLGLHFLVVLIHSIVTLWSRQSSESWNSISELIALSYTSSPRPETLNNCGAGIMLQETLRQKVKIVAVEDHRTGVAQKLQLVPCQKQPTIGSLLPSAYAAIEVDRQYR